MKRILRTLLIVVVLVSNISCDQISKTIARQNISENYPITIGSYLMLIKVENSGAFLSLGSSLPQPVRLFLLTILPVMVLFLALVFVLTNKNLSNTTTAGICFVVGGGIGNIFDRLVYGSVTDFLHLDFGVIRTGIFNMADVSIVIGVCIVILESAKGRIVVEGADKF